jgi:biopolymer transport protein ExbB
MGRSSWKKVLSSIRRNSCRDLIAISMAIGLVFVLLTPAGAQPTVPGTQPPSPAAVAPEASSSGGVAGTPASTSETTTGESPAVTPPMMNEPSVAPSALPAPQAGSAVDASLLPHDLSPWRMFPSAHPVVKSVMILLVLASILTWTVCLSKSLEIRSAKREARGVLNTLSQTRTLREAADRIGKNNSPAGEMVTAAINEVEISSELPNEGIKERVASLLDQIEATGRHLIMHGTGILATIGSISPFVGLFGTVWGIMNSFIGISKAHTTNLAVVAPGIAEALLATALGLVAAIPAVIIYNAFARSIAAYRALLDEAAAAVLRLVSRELDGQEIMPRAKAAR